MPHHKLQHGCFETFHRTIGGKTGWYWQPHYRENNKETCVRVSYPEGPFRTEESAILVAERYYPEPLN